MCSAYDRLMVRTICTPCAAPVPLTTNFGAIVLAFNGVGFCVPTPTFPPESHIGEHPRSVGSINTPMQFIVPEFCRGRKFGPKLIAPEPLPAAAAPPLGIGMKADAGLPPNVSASAAFKAYGTLTSRTRGCSASPGRLN